MPFIKNIDQSFVCWHNRFKLVWTVTLTVAWLEYVVACSKVFKFLLNNVFKYFFEWKKAQTAFNFIKLQLKKASKLKKMLLVSLKHWKINFVVKIIVETVYAIFVLFSFRSASLDFVWQRKQQEGFIRLSSSLKKKTQWKQPVACA